MFRLELQHPITDEAGSRPDSPTTRHVAGLRLFRFESSLQGVVVPPSSTVVALAVPRSFDVVSWALKGAIAPKVTTIIQRPSVAVRRDSGLSPGDFSFSSSPSSSSSSSTECALPMVVFEFASADTASAFVEKHHGFWVQGSGENAQASLCLKLAFVESIAESSEVEPSGGGGSDKSCGLMASSQQWELPCCPVCLDRLDPGVAGVGPGVCVHQTRMNVPAAPGEGEGACGCWAAVGRSERHCTVCATISRAAAGVILSLGGGAVAPQGAGGAAGELAGNPANGLFAPPAALGDTALVSPAVSCAECLAEDRLWSCLVCGYVGCGRYTDAHSLQHFYASGHRWALDLVSRSGSF